MNTHFGNPFAYRPTVAKVSGGGGIQSLDDPGYTNLVLQRR
jgi:hypothetical protein